MKAIRGFASALVRTPTRECFSLLAAVDRYREWNRELVRELDVLDRGPDQLPSRVRAVIAIRRSPLIQSIELTASVRADPPKAIYMTRIPNEPSDREELDLVWRLRPDDSASGTWIELEFAAVASFIPGLMPLGGVGNRIAERLVGSATEALGGASG
jgi:hypothetical protein